MELHNDIDPKVKIRELTPNMFLGEKEWKWINGRLNYGGRLGFMGYPKFSRNIYKKFYWIWWLFHQWDQFFAEKYAPSLDLGFALLQSYNAGDDAQVGLRNTIPKGQTFTHTVRHNITSVKLKHFRSGTVGNTTVDIYATSGGVPTGSVLATKTQDMSGVTTTSPGQFYEYVLTTNPELSANTMYAIVCYTADDNNNLLMRKDDSSPSYSGGTFITTAPGSWTADSTSDGLFEEYGTEITTVDYTIVCAQGSYTLTGQALTLKKALKIVMAQGSYVLTGIAASVGKNYSLALAVGTYVLTGIATNFTKALKITMAQGSYTLTGIALTLTRQIRMTLEKGAYTLTGIALLFVGWIKRVKPSIGTWTPRTKPSGGGYTARTKPSSSDNDYTKRTKPLP